jgi:hypothetical protein
MKVGNILDFFTLLEKSSVSKENQHLQWFLGFQFPVFQFRRFICVSLKYILLLKWLKQFVPSLFQKRFEKCDGNGLLHSAVPIQSILLPVAGMMRFHIYMQSLSIFKINLIFFSTAK